MHVRAVEGPLSLEEIAARVVRDGAGAVVSFQGVTREVERLDYEAYREMAEERIAAILRDCVQRHALEAAAAEHRIGSVPLGEASVIVSVSAAHRDAAFAGAREAIDRIKAEAPIWKREVEGSEGRWVEGTPAPHAETRPKGEGRAGVSAGCLSHLGPDGSARMVDVGEKAEGERMARARAVLRMSPETARTVAAGDGPKGEIISPARIAGIAAAKRTGELIPLAHPLPLTFADVNIEILPKEGIARIDAEARVVGRTGVEMEAMTACAVAALTVYDMVKGLERGATIESIELVEKLGGRSGHWRRAEAQR